jgi:hypothetical protein
MRTRCEFSYQILRIDAFIVEHFRFIAPARSVCSNALQIKLAAGGAFGLTIAICFLLGGCLSTQNDGFDFLADERSVWQKQKLPGLAAMNCLSALALAAWLRSIAPANARHLAARSR